MINQNKHNKNILNIFSENIVGILNIQKYVKHNILDEIICSNNEITKIINIPSNVKILRCTFNKLENLDDLPENLEKLYCEKNFIKKLENLPQKLKILSCSYNQIKNLDYLPESLEELYCNNNFITELNNLPKNILIVNCKNNIISEFKNLDIEIVYM